MAWSMSWVKSLLHTVYSQLEAMGIQHLHARTNLGFDLKARASLLALAFTNIIAD